MTNYTAKSTDANIFSLTRDDITLGNLKYDSWFSFKAEINVVDDRAVEVQPKGFWGTTIEVKKEEKVLLDFKMNWKGQILLHSRLDNLSRYFIFSQKGVFKNKFILMNEQEKELLVLEPNYKWSKLTPDYLITTSAEFEELVHKEILLLTIVHCTNYYITMMSAVAV